MTELLRVLNALVKKECYIETHYSVVIINKKTVAVL